MAITNQVPIYYWYQGSDLQVHMLGWTNPGSNEFHHHMYAPSSDFYNANVRDVGPHAYVVFSDGTSYPVLRTNTDDPNLVRTYGEMTTPQGSAPAAANARATRQAGTRQQGAARQSATRGGGSVGHYSADGSQYFNGQTWVPATQASGAMRPTQAPRPATRYGQQGAARQPQRSGMRSHSSQGWTVAGSPPHAYRGNVDLGLLVNDRQTVKPTNGGRLWALYDLNPDGSQRFVGSYGSVAGAPPPPNAAANQVPQQFYPPPATQAPPMYAPPAYSPYAPPPVYAMPAPAYPTQDVMVPQVPYAPAYAPPPVYAPPPAPATYALPPQPGAPYGLDPVTGMPLTADQAAVYAQYGTQAFTQQFQEGQQADALAQSILAGGGVSAEMGGLSGMLGGLDASTLAMLSGGDGDLALQMALANGGYDPEASAVLNPIPGA